MSSALKPALPQGAGGQTGAAQNNSALNNVGGAQALNHNSQGHAHLGHHPHMGQNMAHIPQNLGHMQQNLGHIPHLGHLGGNSTHLPGGFNASQGAKGANHSAPLSLVQEKPPSQVNASQPLALTRTPEKEAETVQPDQSSQSNGTSESPKIEASNSAEPATETLAPEPKASPVKSGPSEEKEKVVEPVIDKNGADVSKPTISETHTANTEAPSPAKSTPVESEPSVLVEQIKNKETVPEKPKEVLAPSDKVETPVEKPTSPLKTPESKPEPEPKSVAAEEPPKKEEPAIAAPVEEKKEDKPAPVPAKEPVAEEKPVEKIDTKEKVENIPPVVTVADSPAKPIEAVVEKSPAKESPANLAQSPVTPAPKKTEIKPKSTLKLATVTPTLSRKRKKDLKMPLQNDGPSPPKRVPITPKEKPAPDTPKMDTSSLTDMLTPDSRSSKRNRTKVQPYQIPTPEIALLTKLSASQGRTTPTKQMDEKLIVFYKNEFLAVRNTEGGFYVCQTMQNVYRSTRKIKIRWLSQDKSGDPSGEIYKPDFYDVTDIDCVLTTLSLQRAGTAGLKLGAAELSRTNSILGRALAAERGEPAPDTSVTEEHPDGLDLSLYKDESQLEKKKLKSALASTPSRKRPHSAASSPSSPSDGEETPPPSPPKSALRKRSSRPSPKSKAKSPRAGKKPIKTPVKTPAKTPVKAPVKTDTPTPPPAIAPSTSKTATPPAKPSPAAALAKRRPPAKAITPVPSTSKGKTGKPTPAKVAAAAKAAVLASTPSTSTGKTTRTPRKPPSKK